MRRFLKITAIVSFLCFLGSDMFGQDLNSILPTGSFHPLINYGRIRENKDIDTIFTNVYYENWKEYEKPQLLMRKIYRSEDNLADTVFSLSTHYYTGEHSRIDKGCLYKYNEKNQLLSIEDVWNEIPSGLGANVRTEYEYDAEGRVVKIVAKQMQLRESLLEPSPLLEIPLEKVLNECIYDYSNIQMTEKGYFFRHHVNDYQNDRVIVNDWNVELDDQERMTFVKTISHYNAKIELDNQGKVTYSNLFLGQSEEDKYAEYVDGKKYLIDATYYTYTDSSWTSIGCYDQGKWLLDGKIWWNETTYVFDNDGNVKSRIQRASYDGKDWEFFWQEEYAYAYSNERENPGTYSGDEVSNNPVGKTNTVVYAHSGAILISTENIAMAQIFDLTGRLVKQQSVSSGENRVGISGSGFYIVKVGNESFKVFVR